MPIEGTTSGAWRGRQGRGGRPTGRRRSGGRAGSISRRGAAGWEVGRVGHRTRPRESKGVARRPIPEPLWLGPAAPARGGRSARPARTGWCGSSSRRARTRPQPTLAGYTRRSGAEVARCSPGIWRAFGGKTRDSRPIARSVSGSANGPTEVVCRCRCAYRGHPSSAGGRQHRRLQRAAVAEGDKRQHVDAPPGAIEEGDQASA